MEARPLEAEWNDQRDQQHSKAVGGSNKISLRAVAFGHQRHFGRGAYRRGEVGRDARQAFNLKRPRSMHAMGIPGHPSGKTVLSYFPYRSDVLMDLDRLMLGAWYSPEMRPGATPLEALAVLSEAVARQADLGVPAEEAAERTKAFNQRKFAQMEAFANGQGEVPDIVLRSGKASQEYMHTTRSSGASTSFTTPGRLLYGLAGILLACLPQSGLCLEQGASLPNLEPFDKAVLEVMTSTPNSASPSIRLYSARLSMFGAKVQIAAIEKGIALDVVMVPFSQAQGYSPKDPEVVRINPKKQVPVLVHGDIEVFDSTQILEYLEDLRPAPALWLSGINNRARARQLEHRSDEVYFPHVIKLMGLQDRLDDPVAVVALQCARDFYRYLEPLLGAQDYMLGDFSNADIALYMAMLFGERMSAPLTAETPRLLAWRDRMSARASVRQVVRPMAEYLLIDGHGRPLPAFLAKMLHGD